MNYAILEQEVEKGGRVKIFIKLLLLNIFKKLSGKFIKSDFIFIKDLK